MRHTSHRKSLAAPGFEPITFQRKSSCYAFPCLQGLASLQFIAFPLMIANDLSGSKCQ